MDITDMDRINAVQQKLCEVKTWVDETLRILYYVCVDESHKKFKSQQQSCSYQPPLSKVDLYPGQLPPVKDKSDSKEECDS